MEYRIEAFTTRQAKAWTRLSLWNGHKALILLPLPARLGTREELVVVDGCPLSFRELQVVNGLSQGMTNGEIGDILSLSRLTIKSHLARIARKVGTSDRAGIVGVVMRAGWLD